MRKRPLLILAAHLCLALTSCVSVTPVLNSYEKAGTLGQGNAELLGSYTGYNSTAYEQSFHSHDAYGFRVGYGFTDRFDLKLRYEHAVPVVRQGKREPATNYYSLIPKVALLPRYISLSVPLSHYTFKEAIEDKTYNREVASIASQLHFTYTLPGNKVDLTGGFKADFLYGKRGWESEQDLLLSTSVGAGFSSNLDRWAIRPEAGWVRSSAHATSYITYGVGVQYTLWGKRQKR